MKKLFNILIYAMISICIIGCCTQKKVGSSDVLGSSMKVELHIDDAKAFQVDSLITADTLPSLDKWISSTFIDYNTNKPVVKRMYIKQYSLKHEILYLVIGESEPFEIIKRVEKKMVPALILGTYKSEAYIIYSNDRKIMIINCGIQLHLS